MDTRSYTNIDRAALGWPSGPWDGEPDKVQWQDAATNLPCLAVRNGRFGHWCGYVGVAPEHPLHGKDFCEFGFPVFDVHGGVNFASGCQQGEDEDRGICHRPEPGEPDHVWWFGFDCWHFGDYSPGLKIIEDALGFSFKSLQGRKYRSLAYVQRECANLAAQLAGLTP